jgi:hypothetical protein
VSNADGFIEEVTEEVRKDQLFAMYKKYGWIAVVVIVGIVGGAGLIEYRKASAQSAAEARGDSLITALNMDDASARNDALAAIGNSDDSTAVIAELHRAGMLMEEGDQDGALAIYDALKSGDGIYAQVATLKAILIRGNDMDMTQRMAELDGLATPGNPFRTLAIEQKAMAQLDAGDKDMAIETLTSLLDEAGVSQAMISRTRQMIVALGGELPSATRLLSSATSAQ